MALTGCGLGRAGEGSPIARPLASDVQSAVLAPAQLDRAHQAAAAFAHSYAASARGPAVVRNATPSLAAQLRANRARSAGEGGGPALHLLALAIDPQSVSRVEATATLAARGEEPFPIAFVLRLIGGRWLATRLPGN